MISSVQAASLAKDKIFKDSKKQLENISNKILKEAKNGKCSTEIEIIGSFDYIENIIDYLILQGFSIKKRESFSFEHKEIVTISWYK